MCEMCGYILHASTIPTLFRFHLLLLWAQKVAGIIIISPELPEVYKRVTLSCYSDETSRTWYHTESRLSICNSQNCLPKALPEIGYIFTADNGKSEVTISSLNRTRDSGLWKCSSGGDQSIILDVYSFPSGLSFTHGGDTEVDLAESQTILQCQTDGCTYPTPTIKWYFKDIAPSAPRTFYNDTGTQVTGGSCTSPEELYTSRLELPLHTIWQSNTDKNVTLSCGIEYSNFSRNVYSQESKQIRYAVRVTEAVIQKMNRNITDTLNVTAGVQASLTCLTGTSRPPATIGWYLGFQSKGIGAIWNFTPTPADHNGTFYCQVYNTAQNLKIDSNKARLYVKVPIDSVQLRNGTALTLNEGQLVVIVCETGACRPSAAIYWMKNGANITDSSSGVTEINVGNDMFVSRGTLNYTGQRLDNGKSLRCGAYSEFDRGLASEGLTVTIYYPPDSLPEIDGRISGSSLIVIEHISQSLTCRIIGGNPLANLSWICLGHIGISITSGQTVVSEIILDVDRSAQDQRCTCRTSHPADRNKDVFVLLQVHYAPDVKVTLTGSNQQNQTAILICEPQGVPAVYTFYAWVHMWEDMVIMMGLHGKTSASQSILTIDRLSLENMGTYFCTTNNGITGINGHINQTGSEKLTVTGMPNILDNNAFFVGDIGMSVDMSIPLYSNPVLENFFIHRNGTEIINNSRIMTRLTWDLVNYTFYGSMVRLKAQKAHLIIQNLTHEDFGNYTLELRNSIGETDFSFQLDAFGPPFAVLRFYFNRFVGNTIELHFDPGVNGGPSQTFVIEEKYGAESNGVWQNTSVTNLQETERQNQFKNGTFFVSITKHLIPGIYQYRIYSWNIKGKSEFSKSITVTVPGDGTPRTFGIPVTEIAVGVSAGFVVIVVVGIGIFLWRRYHHKKQNEDETDGMNDHEERSVRHDTAKGQEYEGLHLTGAEASPYLQLTDFRLEGNRTANIRSPERDSYEKLHTYANSDIQMYSLQKVPEVSKDSKRMYENTQIK